MNPSTNALNTLLCTGMFHAITAHKEVFKDEPYILIVLGYLKQAEFAKSMTQSAQKAAILSHSSAVNAEKQSEISREFAGTAKEISGSLKSQVESYVKDLEKSSKSSKASFIISVLALVVTAVGEIITILYK